MYSEAERATSETREPLPWLGWLLGVGTVTTGKTNSSTGVGHLRTAVTCACGNRAGVTLVDNQIHFWQYQGAHTWRPSADTASGTTSGWSPVLREGDSSVWPWAAKTRTSAGS